MSADPRLKPSPHHDHGYAIIRCDSSADESVPLELRVTVKKVVYDAEFAESEVRRLNKLNHDKNCHYFSQVTRIERGIPAKVETPDIPEEVLSSAHAD